ncbi:MAG: type II toxin-antitoxin system RelE/ParE family toxin [Ruminococcus sp.]|uniref:type II toxin-antitoxin system RelE/ParE family toxin n=1 Tax=Ruminococcus sp. TaxID=41978 RepID=UPI002872C0FB|nr:type II toxin-antitoxin system RelE/ParE family toxin [Ruminococcus sp.]MBQ3284941.1 type II toxin-antitoxin system RelE/ParE family toxin [Ruminococcus sp.]
MRLIYSPQARTDLREIKAYIRDNLQNPIAAENVTQRILKGCALLKDNPLLGAALSEKVNRETDIRYLIIDHHIAFYKTDKNAVYVIRIRNARTNYMHIIFQ